MHHGDPGPRSKPTRKNARKSTGPKSPAGKGRIRFNGLKHGLRPTRSCGLQSVAEFQARRRAGEDDWGAKSHTAAVLVERAAIASWRLRRCVRAEADLLLREHVERARDDGRGRDDDVRRDDDIAARLDEAATRGSTATRPGITSPSCGRALRGRRPPGRARWDELDEVLGEDHAEAWGCDREHDLLVALLGHEWDVADLAAVGPMAVDSRRLTGAVGNWADYQARDDDGRAIPDGFEPFPAAEVEDAVGRLRAGIARERAALRALRGALLARAEAEGDAEDAAAGATFAGASHELMLLHRYEMAHERSLRVAIKDLVALEKARPDLCRPDRGSQVTTVKTVTPIRPATPAAANPPAAAPSTAPTGANPAAAPAPPDKRKRGRGGRPRRPGAVAAAASPPSHS